MFSLADLEGSESFQSLGDEDREYVRSTYIQENAPKINSLWESISSSDSFLNLSDDDRLYVRDQFGSQYGILPEFKPQGLLARLKQYDPIGGAKDVGKMLYDIPVQTKGALGNLLEDADPLARDNFADKWQQEAKERSAQRTAEISPADRAKKVIPLPEFLSENGAMTRGDIQDAAQSTGFSAVAMGGGLLGGLAGSLAGGWGAIPGRMAGSGAAAYKMDKSMITRQLLDATEQAKGSALTDYERQQVLDKTEDIRNNHALWEAGPEAVGTALSLTGIGKIFSGAAKGMTGKIISGLTMNLGGELSTETITQIGQNIAEHDLGLGQGEKMSWDTESAKKALQEVAPSVLALTSVTGGGGYVAGKTYKGIFGTEEKIPEKSPDKAADKLINATTVDEALEAHEELKDIKADILAESALLDEIISNNPALPTRQSSSVPAELGSMRGMAGTSPLFAPVTGNLRNATGTSGPEFAPVVEQPEVEAAPTTSEPESTTQEQIEATQPDFTKKSGQPFASEKSLIASARSNGVDLTGYDIVQVDGGFKATPKKTDDIARAATGTSTVEAPVTGNLRDAAGTAGPEMVEPSQPKVTEPVTNPLPHKDGGSGDMVGQDKFDPMAILTGKQEAPPPPQSDDNVAISALDEFAAQLDAEVKDWSIRKYKESKTRVTAGGTADDLNSVDTTAGAANERRRQSNIATRTEAIAEIQKAKEAIRTGKNSKEVYEQLLDSPSAQVAAFAAKQLTPVQQSPQFTTAEQGVATSGGVDTSAEALKGTKAVDKDGNPQRVFHGGPELEGSTFRVGPSGGIFFASNKRTAGIHKMGTKTGKVHEAYLNLQNPYEVDYRGTDITRNNAEESIREAKANGHDGVIIRNFIDIPENRLDVAKRFGVQHKYSGDIYIAFSPDQIIPVSADTTPSAPTSEPAADTGGGGIYEAGGTGELMLLRKRSDGLVMLQDTKDNVLGTFPDAKKAAEAARDMGYRWRDETGQLPKRPATVKEKPKKVVKPKVTRKTVGAFRSGMRDGATFTSLGTKEDSLEIAAVKAGYGQRATETKAYIEGYKLGSQEKYVKAWKDDRDLVSIAVEAGDINNADFDIYQSGSIGEKRTERHNIFSGKYSTTTTSNQASTQSLTPSQRRVVAKLEASGKVRLVTAAEAEAVLREAGIDPKYMVAWHGSPYDHDGFSMDKVGTGEGAQAYGYGLYFAGAKNVAEWYRNKLSSRSVMGGFGQGRVETLDKFFNSLTEEEYGQVDALLQLDDGYGYSTREDFIADINGNNPQDIDEWFDSLASSKFSKKLMSFSKEKGRLYQVELAPKEDEYLLWDRPLSEQSEKVKAIIAKFPADLAALVEYQNELGANGSSIYRVVADYLRTKAIFSASSADLANGSVGKDADKAASEYLHSLGIRGNKYLDGTSRGKGEGNFNYVLFSDQDVSITAKYSKSGKIQGFQIGDKAYVIPENVEGSIWPVVLHEVGTHLRKLLLDNPTFQRLLDSLEARKDEQSKTGDAIRAAMARVPDDTGLRKGETYETLSPERKAEVDAIRAEENLAYLCEMSPETGIVRRFIALIKRLLVKMGVDPKIFTVADLAAMADAAVRKEANKGVTNEKGRGKRNPRADVLSESGREIGRQVVSGEGEAGPKFAFAPPTGGTPRSFAQVQQEAPEPNSEEAYAANRASSVDHKAEAIRGVKAVGREVAAGVDKFLGAISTRLANINPKLRERIRDLDFNIGTKHKEDIKAVEGMLKKAKKMSKDDFADWDLARKNSDVNKINELVEKYEMEAEYASYRETLKRIREESIAVGRDVGMIEDYSPRIIKDSRGFLEAIGKGPERGNITSALRRRAEEMGITVGQMTPEMKADIVSNMILGGGQGLFKPSNTEQRKIKSIPPELNRYYMASDAALMSYLHSMRKDIEARKFFGKMPERVAKVKKAMHVAQAKVRELQKREDIDQQRIDDINETIGEYQAVLDRYKTQTDYHENIATYVIDLINSGEVSETDERALTDILSARFHESGTRGNWQAYKNLSYIDTMGSPISALTQIGDFAWVVYRYGMTAAIRNAYKSVVKQSRVTKEDIGIERIAQEFADPGTLSNAVAKVFKIVGLEKMDSIGKEALLNSALEDFEKRAISAPEKLKREIQVVFGSKTDSVIIDLVNKDITDNVKRLVYGKLLDFQPAALSEQSEYYLQAGNGRVFYMLKSYTLKQFDVFRNEAYNKIKTGEKAQVIEGLRNMVYLAMCLVLANAGADELKDLVLGRETSLEDRTVDNILRLFGVSKFVTWKARSEGLGSAMAKQILPPYKFIDSVSRDIWTAGDEKGLRMVDSIPIIGKLAYWHIGRGAKSNNELWDRRLAKERSRLNDIKERVDGDRTLRQKHLKDLARLNRINKLQGTLNKRRKAINRLKELEKKTGKDYSAKIEMLDDKRTELIESFMSK